MRIVGVLEEIPGVERVPMTMALPDETSRSMRRRGRAAAFAGVVLLSLFTARGADAQTKEELGGTIRPTVTSIAHIE